MTTEEYVRENKRRQAVLFEPYDPYIGTGSKVPRFECIIDRDRSLYLPRCMENDWVTVEIMTHGSMEAYAHNSRFPLDELERQFVHRRIKHDFEFWAASAALIKDKETAEIVPFIFNIPQRILTWELEQQRWAREPIREVILKHRQWGCTTYSYTYVGWHQIELYMNRDAWFIGLDKEGAEDVVQRYRLILDNYPFQDLEFARFGRSPTARWIPQRNCVINVGTVEKPNAPSGRTPQYAHLFEVGKWPSTPVVNAENVVQNVDSMVHDYPGTIKIMESTAKADTGTYFKKLCEQAEVGKTADRFFFVSWLTDPTCTRDLDVREDEFIQSWTEYDKFLWDQGASFEQIVWYKNQKTKAGYITKPHAIKEEFPTTSVEAFQTGAKRVFPAVYVHTLRKTCMEPLARGELYAEADSGYGAFKEIRFEKASRGRLSIWRFPGDDYGGQLEETARYAYRYLCATDVGGVWEGADFNDAAVLDRAPILFSERPEIVAEWNGHIPADEFAWLSARLAYWYSMAELIVEANKYEPTPFQDDDNFTAPDASLTILDKLVGVYPYLYMRQVLDERTQAMTSKAGFHMNERSKQMCIDALGSNLRQFHEDKGGYIERSLDACEEMDYYLKVRARGGNKYVTAAAAGHNDDRVMVRGMLLWRDETLPPPKKVENVQRPKRAASMVRF